MNLTAGESKFGQWIITIKEAGVADGGIILTVKHNRIELEFIFNSLSNGWMNVRKGNKERSLYTTEQESLINRG